MDIITFLILHYPNEESDDVIGGFTKKNNTQSTKPLKILKLCSLNLGPEMYITKQRKWHLSCRCHDNSFVTGPVLIETKIPTFYLKKRPSTPNNLIERVKTTWEPCLFGPRPSVPLWRVANGAIWFFTERDWSHEYYHSNNIKSVIPFLSWCTFLVTSLKNTAPIFLKIFWSSI